MQIAELEAEAARLELPAFDAETALKLGLSALRLARSAAAPVVIDIRTPLQTLFHVALPGATPENDAWALRKSNTALHFGVSSLLVGERLRAKGRTLGYQGLDTADYADHGGAVPIRVASVGVVAVLTISGLPQIEDHRLAVAALESLLPPRIQG